MAEMLGNCPDVIVLSADDYDAMLFDLNGVVTDTADLQPDGTRTFWA